MSEKKKFVFVSSLGVRIPIFIYSEISKFKKFQIMLQASISKAYSILLKLLKGKQDAGKESKTVNETGDRERR